MRDNAAMSRPAPRSPGKAARLPGLLLAVLALAMQLAAASVIPWTTPQAAGLDRLVAASICHGDSGAADRGGTPPGHHAPACAVCPLCQAIAQAGVLLGSAAVALAAPPPAVSRAAAPPPARAPPARRVAAAAPRGPPALT